MQPVSSPGTPVPKHPQITGSYTHPVQPLSLWNSKAVQGSDPDLQPPAPLAPLNLIPWGFISVPSLLSLLAHTLGGRDP